MTKKQLLLSTLILGVTSNIALAMENPEKSKLKLTRPLTEEILEIKDEKLKLTAQAYTLYATVATDKNDNQIAQDLIVSYFAMCFMKEKFHYYGNDASKNEK